MLIDLKILSALKIYIEIDFLLLVFNTDFLFTVNF